ncbi:TonB-dependent receptor [Marinilabilia salmonicolor]|uniref:TonB-dependent receptor n=1 Tax=Marinilabilia salmonicolor TaxID=989 RepID=UPI000AB1C142|nr:TonB-dependent receptor [Marinilabilia salmonicolor]
MEKFCQWRRNFAEFLPRKLMLAMRLSLGLFLLVSFQTIASVTYSQDTKVTVKMERAHVKEVLKEIEHSSEFYFVYNNELIDVERMVNVEAKNKKIKDVLDALFGNEGVGYTVMGRQIVLSPSEMMAENVSQPQERAVRGTVTDQNGEPIPGVTVTVKGTTHGTITDIDGNFSLKVNPESEVLIFSFVGMKSQEIEIGNNVRFDVVMQEDVMGLDEVVVVGYGIKKKESLTGAIANIQSDEIETSTHSSLAQNLQGKVAGVQIRQNTGGPGDFNSMINIRGFGTPLFVIDGIVRDGAEEFQKLNSSDIESISVLKDASAAIYGMNAANGVIIVTTKKGEEGAPEFNYKGVYGLQTPTDVPQMTNSAQWMEMRNDADINAGGDPYISKEELEKYQQGLPGYGTINWYDETMKDYSTQQQHNLSARGGNETMSYFTSFGYQEENGLLKSDDLNYEKYTLRSNLSIKLTEDLDADINLYGRLDKRMTPGDSFFNIFKGTRIGLPTDRPYANGNSEYYGLVGPSNLNPLALSDSKKTGYYESKNKFFQSSFTLNYDFPYIEGLSFKGIFSYDSNSFLGKDLVKSYKLYSYDEESDSYNATNMREPSIIANTNNDDNRITMQGHLLYNTTINDNHNLDLVLVYEQKEAWGRDSYLRREYDFYTTDQVDFASQNNQRTGGIEYEEANMSYLGRFNYDYKGKYLIEFAARYDGSYRYHPDERWGFFPVVSGGWRISEENFIQENLPFISNLKIRGSYGDVGEDAGNPFQYVPGYSTSGGGGYEFINGEYLNGAASPSIVNRNLTWFVSTIKNIGVDIGLWKGLLNVEFDVYQRDREGLLAYRNISVPNTFGGSLPQENLNSDRVKGIEFSVAHNNQIGDFNYSIGGNFNFARTKNVYVERGPFTSSWDKWRNGSANRWNDVLWGYKVDGQFQNFVDIAHSPIQNGNIGNTKELPGDFKYEDVNGDGVINGNDMQPMFWGGQPKLHYGINLSADWKGFDFYALFQGSGKYTVRFQEVYAEVMAFKGNTPEYFYDRWHLKDPYDPDSEWIPGEWPATRFKSDVGSMYKESSIWRRDASYLRLKSLELGYTFDNAFLKEIGIENLRVYSNGHNLLTFADSFIKPFDPEKIEGAYNAGLTYPLTKSFNFGINVIF